MRVGVYIPDSKPDGGGGYTFEQDVLGSLIKLVPHCKHEFVFFAHNPSKELQDFWTKSTHVEMIRIKNASPLPVELIRKLNNKIMRKQRLYPSNLSFAVDKAEIDFLWCITPFYYPVNVPYIATVWDLQHRLQPWFPEVGSIREWSFRENFYSMMLRRASYIITGTQAGAREISFFYQIQEDRIRVLPHPTPAFALKVLEDDIQAVLEKFRLSPDFLFYPAQFWSHKNHANLLYAIKILRDKFAVSMNLVLAGSDNGNRDYIQQLARSLQIENQVHILGFVSRRDLLALYQSAFALAYVTYFGPENLPPLEAFAMNCPVIASAVSGAEEQLGDAAILVNPNHPEDIARAVKDLLDDPSKRCQLIERGQARASQWSGKDFVLGVFDILDEFEVVRRCWR